MNLRVHCMPTSDAQEWTLTLRCGHPRIPKWQKCGRHEQRDNIEPTRMRAYVHNSNSKRLIRNDHSSLHVHRLCNSSRQSRGRTVKCHPHTRYGAHTNYPGSSTSRAVRSRAGWQCWIRPEALESNHGLVNTGPHLWKIRYSSCVVFPVNGAEGQ